ncbi:hybrid sensor histidine kinase/response regulator transcription factor [Mucilaginibacter gynuensis]|uniref:histidine kinase n=1 Tax=Mucilaginibacter gynuensis TaxID=1302236 RepID=A0ABP8FM48_9SPHI
MLCFLQSRLNAQSYYFSHYQVENGLSNNAVICVLQDRMGFMWFGTKDGLNRFDGYTYKVFRNDPANKRSLGSNFIFSVFEDHYGVIWVGTERGLYYYNRETEDFTFLNNSLIKPTRSIMMDNGHNLWFVSGGLFKYTPKTKKLVSYTSFWSTSVCTSSDGTIWASTPDGMLQKYNPRSNSFSPYSMFSHSKPTSNKAIEKIYDGGNGHILVATSTQGVKDFDTHSNTYTDILTQDDAFDEIYARDFVYRSPNELWIASESGIYIYDKTQNKITNLRKQYNDPYSLSDNAVYSLCKDKEGGIWAGTYFGGANYYPKQYTNFEKYFPKTGQNSLSGNAVREICKDSNNNLWIGTEDAGLNKLNLTTGKFSSFKPNGAKTGISTTNIHGLLINGDQLLIGTFEHGLDVMDLRTEKVVKHFSAGPGKNDLKSNFIYTMLKTREGDIIIGTSWGLFRYNVSDNNFTHISAMPRTSFYTSIMEDSKGNIWVGTFRDGVHCFSIEGKDKFVVKKHDFKIDMSVSRITGLIEDSEQNIWIGTESGLYKYTPSTKKTVEYSVRTGLPNELIYSMLEDAQKRLWISSSKGLMCIDIKTNKLIRYTRSNGLLNDQFNYNSAFEDSNGTMYFGSVKGMISFNPATFKPVSFTPPIYITGFQVHNKELAVNRNGSPLKRSVLLSREITLNDNQSSFSIDFSSLSYTSPATTEYKYKLDGLDRDWTFIKTNRRAYFTELAPGKYHFKVRAANSNNIWQDAEAQLYIEVLPPFWKSTWAYLTYSIIFSFSLYWLITIYHDRLENKNRRKMEDFENKKEKEIYQAKIEFFTNVAHEIRTPLTLIKGPMEKVIKQAGEIPAIEKNLRIMDKNTERLLHLTNQLLDFRKTESNGFSLNFVKVDIVELLKELWNNFQDSAEQKNIDYQIILPKQQLFAYVDHEAFTKIISNLLDNALKYCNSKVKLSLLPVADNEDLFTVKVYNDGKQIPNELHEKIFEPFFRINGHDKKTGTGIGLSISRALAELHKGKLEMQYSGNEFNIFVLTLPVHQLIEFNLNSRWRKH